MNGSAGPVRAKIEAVDKVAQGVRSYLDQEQRLISRSRAQLSAAADRAAAEVRARQAVLSRARREVAALEGALARCRENCGGISRALTAARGRQAEAAQSLARAQQAVQLVEEAREGVQAALRVHEPSLIEHGRAAIESCRQLVTKLSGYLSGSLAAAEIAVTISTVGQGPLPKALLNVPPEPVSIAQLAEDNLNEQNQLWREWKTHELEGDGPTEISRE